MEKMQCSFIERVPHHITCALAAGAGAGELIACKRLGTVTTFPLPEYFISIPCLTAWQVKN